MAHEYLGQCEFRGIDKIVKSPYVPEVDPYDLPKDERDALHRKKLAEETFKNRHEKFWKIYSKGH